MGNLEAIYHGEERVTGVRRAIYNVLTRGRRRRLFEGHVPESPLFWGDLCAERISYVRNFVYRDTNTLAACPHMPYRDSAKPSWPPGSPPPRAPIPPRSCARSARPHQDRLEAEGGLAIMYTHLGAGFWRGGRLDPQFEAVMRMLAKRDGWFAPVAEILDHLHSVKGVTELDEGKRHELEWRWIRDKLRTGSTT